MDALAVARLLNRGSNERWGNLGAWAPGDRYGEAARRLACELGERAALAPGQRVLDVGCGCGEQLAVWTGDFGVQEVVALEPDPAAFEAARARVAAAGLSDRVSLRAAGVSRLADLPDASFDRVLALDCAYLFGDRTGWTREAFRLLRPGGVLAATDLVLGDRGRSRVIERLAPVFGIAPDHLVAPDAYRREHAEAGFSATEVRLETSRVLRGFARHVRGRLPGLVFGGGAAVPVLVTAAACALAARSGRVDYAFVRSTRPA